MKAIEQYFHVVLIIMLYKVVLAFMSVDETLVCHHSNESYRAVLSCCNVYCAVQGGCKLKIIIRFPNTLVYHDYVLQTYCFCSGGLPVHTCTEIC